MGKSLNFKSVFAMLSLGVFLLCSVFIFTSCKNNTTDNNKQKEKEKDQNQEENKLFTEITMEKFEQIMNDPTQLKDNLVIDVRTDNEYKAGHTFCAVHIPYDRNKFSDKSKWGEAFDSRLIDDMKDKNVILQCQTKNRSPQVAEILTAADRGFKKVYWVYGVDGFENAQGNPPRTFDKKFRTGETKRGSAPPSQPPFPIPAIRFKQIETLDGVKVVDIHSASDFKKDKYAEKIRDGVENASSEESIKEKIDSLDQEVNVVIVGKLSALDAFEVAKKFAEKGFKKVHTCVETY